MESKNKSWQRLLKCLPTFIFILLLSACTEPPAPSLRQVDRELIDSLYSMHYDSVKTILDSQCVLLKEEIIEQATDSILQRRLIEKAKLSNKYKEELKIEN